MSGASMIGGVVTGASGGRLGRTRPRSPTGRSIDYTTGTTDNTDVYLIGIDGRGKLQLSATPDSDIDPSWSPLKRAAKPVPEIDLHRTASMIRAAVHSK